MVSGRSGDKLLNMVEVEEKRTRLVRLSLSQSTLIVKGDIGAQDQPSLSRATCFIGGVLDHCSLGD